MAQDRSESLEKDVQTASTHFEEKPSALELSKDDVGYREYLESLDIVFSRKEENWVRWKIDVSPSIS